MGQRGRKRTGTLTWDKARGVYKTRITVVENGRSKRPWYSLGTANEELAKKKREALLVDIAKKEADATKPSVDRAAPRFAALALEWLDGRKGRVVFADSEDGYVKRWILPRVPAETVLADVAKTHVRAVIRALVDAEMGHQTIVHVVGTFRRILDTAVRRDLLVENVARQISLAQELRDLGFKAKDQKQRSVLADEEFEQFMRCPEIDLEIQILGLVARCVGGMPTRDVNALTYEHFDLPDFAWGVVPRTKTKKPQKFELPPLVRARLAAWWLEHGKPLSGPVFPVRRGPRKGEARLARGVSFAKRLRRALRTAGITRTELHRETPFSLPVDFHSFRRAFSSALANAGVNEQTAMALTGHADARAHRRYLTDVDARRAAPLALPDFVRSPAEFRPENRLGVSDATKISNDFRSGKRDSNPRPSAWEADALPTELLPQRAPPF